MKTLPHLNYTQLASLLKISYPLTPPQHINFNNWSMEKDDAPILRYLFRHFQPQRHLEFGTWEGRGCLYCLEECNATIWTINLWQGESKANGEWAYGTYFPYAHKLSLCDEFIGELQDGTPVIWKRTDSGPSIGHLYRNHGYGHRVNQIYCNSLDWDISNYPSDFFDTVLIDGGHRAETVLSDTRKALKVTRSGALLLWHDYCEQCEVIQQNQSVKGVVSAINTNLNEITEQLQGIYWIYPSFLLLGIKK